MKRLPRETELKFALPPDHVLALAGQIPALTGSEPKPLVSVYFDTPKQSLRRAGLTLRVRTEDGRFVQTLKQTAAGALSRGEWSDDIQSPAPAPDLLGHTPARACLAKGPALAPQFEIETRRRSAEIIEAGSRIEVSLDEGEAKADGKAAPFAELELELKEGPLWGLLALARKLAQLDELSLSFTSKAERGFALARPSRLRAQKFQAPELNRTAPTGDAFRAVARACLRQIVGNAEALRERASPEVIHQLRVGLRRLRSLVTTFKDVISDARLPALKAELKWLTGELDAARNLDVLLHGGYRVALGDKQAPDGLKGLGARLRGARRISYARAASAAESERSRRLLLDLLIWIEEGPWTQAAEGAPVRDQPIPKFARKALNKRFRKIVRRGGDVAALDPAARHKLRIDAKKLRYAADAFAGLYDHPKRTRAFIAALKVVQDELGELNDIAVGEGLAHDAATSAGLGAGDAAFAAGRIAGARKSEMESLLGKAQDALDALAKARPFWPS
ncbi:MAG: CHAD domain-containing protein [Caulobacteraceae bacterium]|nr:CHAD domain-containing protein [Caulobacteraceae bacterium]